MLKKVIQITEIKYPAFLVFWGTTSLDLQQEGSATNTAWEGSGGLRVCARIDMGVSENSGTPKSSILIGFSEFSILNHPFRGTHGYPYFGNTHMHHGFYQGSRDCWCSFLEFPHGNYWHKLTMKKHSTHRIQIHHGILCPWNPSHKTSTIPRRFHFPWGRAPGMDFSWPSSGQLAVYIKHQKGPLRIPRNPCGIQAAWNFKYFPVRQKRLVFCCRIGSDDFCENFVNMFLMLNLTHRII